MPLFDSNKTNTQDILQVSITGLSNIEADVETIDGKNHLFTTGRVTVDQVLGRDPIPDNYLTVTNTGSSGSTIKIDIAATASDPTSPDRDIAALTKTFTTQVSEVGNEQALVSRMAQEINADATWQAAFIEAEAINSNDGRAILHVSCFSDVFSLSNEFYERTGSSGFELTLTGTAVAARGFSDGLVSRSKSTSLTRDPNNPHRLGVLGFSGSFVPGEIASEFQKFLKDSGGTGSSAMNVNGSVTPVVFQFNPDTERDTNVFGLTLMSDDNGSVKFGSNFMAITALTNGLLLEIKANNKVFTNLPVIKTTQDIKSRWTKGNQSNFRLDPSPSVDDVGSLRAYENPILIRRDGFFGVGNNDYIRVTVRDNLTTIQTLMVEVIGTLK